VGTWVPALGGAPEGNGHRARGCEQCRRLRRGLLSALTERDPRSLAAQDVARHSGLPESTIAAHYGTVDACFVATFDELSDELHRCHVEAFAGPEDWHARFAVAVDASLEHMVSMPGALRLFFADSARGDPRIRVARTAACQRFIRLLADEYELEYGARLPHVHFEFLVGALFQAAQSEFAAGREAAEMGARVKELLALLEPVAA
jgi:AcrR family transcriptional regulator